MNADGSCGTMRRCLFEQCINPAEYVGPSKAADGTYVTYACLIHVDAISEPRPLRKDREREDEEFRESYREWYEEWWVWDLPGRGEADVRYDRLYTHGEKREVPK